MQPSTEEEWQKLIDAAERRVESLESWLKKELPKIVEDLLLKPQSNPAETNNPREMDGDADLSIKGFDATTLENASADGNFEQLKEIADEDWALNEKKTMAKMWRSSIYRMMQTTNVEDEAKNRAKSQLPMMLKKFVDSEMINREPDIKKKTEQALQTMLQGTPSVDKATAERAARSQVVKNMERELSGEHEKRLFNTLYLKVTLPQVLWERLVPKIRHHRVEVEARKLSQLDGEHLRAHDPTWNGSIRIWNGNSFNSVVDVVSKHAVYVRRSFDSQGGKKEYYEAVPMDLLRKAGVKTEDIKANATLTFSTSGKAIKI